MYTYPRKSEGLGKGRLAAEELSGLVVLRWVDSEVLVMSDKLDGRRRK